MTGMHPGHAEVRDNREAQPEGQFPLSASAVTLAALLKQQGYATGAFGKWGLGPVGSVGDPNTKGFDEFFGYNCQRQAHNYYPTYLYRNSTKVPLNNPAFSAYQKLKKGANPLAAESYTGFAGNEYAPDLIAEQARSFVKTQAAAHKPFFLYYPTTVPHVALQVPEDSLAEYLGKLDDVPYLGEQSYLPHRAPHAAYAAMVTRMDREIGRLFDLIRQLGLDENTLFVFTSDNGPVYDRVGGSDAAYFHSAGPLNGFKGSLYEGGVRVPMIVRWKGRVKAGSESDRVTGFEDWLPTLLDATAGKAGPKLADHVDGVSFLPTILSKKQAPRKFMYREFAAYGGQQAIWSGEWKAIRQKLMPTKKVPNPVITTELYNLSTDVSEKFNVAAQHPDIVARMESMMVHEHSPSVEFPIPALDALAKPANR
jgi:arylsulfatase A-like enzyme